MNNKGTAAQIMLATAHPKTIFPRTLSNVMQFDAYGPQLRIGFP